MGIRSPKIISLQTRSLLVSSGVDTRRFAARETAVALPSLNLPSHPSETEDGTMAPATLTSTRFCNHRPTSSTVPQPLPAPVSHNCSSSLYFGSRAAHAARAKNRPAIARLALVKPRHRPTCRPSAPRASRCSAAQDQAHSVRPRDPCVALESPGVASSPHRSPRPSAQRPIPGPMLCRPRVTGSGF